MRTYAEKQGDTQAAALDQGPDKAATSPLKGMSYAQGAAAMAPVQMRTAAAQSLGAPDPKGILSEVHPALADRMRTLIANAHARGLNIKLFEGMRSFKRQADLYAQGRTKPGQIVTWVGPGGSYHNYGMAVDVIFHGPRPWGEEHDWNALGAAGRAAGLTWGGSYGDRPHFNLGQVSITQLKAWHAEGGMTRAWSKVSDVYGGPSFEPPSGDGTYIVKPGDILATIAQRTLGRADAWREIAALNGITDPRKLQIGQVLQIPNGRGGAQPVAGGATYTVRSGDTLGEIAERYLGRAARWQEIARLNGISDPTKLRVGQKLKLPAGSSGGGGGAPPAPKPTRSHTVRAGETLGGIAQSHLGSFKRWKEIADLNGIRDPTKLRIGQRLTLPA